jgi:hypothetical protein
MVVSVDERGYAVRVELVAAKQTAWADYTDIGTAPPVVAPVAAQVMPLDPSAPPG